MRLSLCLSASLLLFFSSVALPATAQTGPAEGCLLHLSKPFFTTGEVIWYALYLPPGYQDRSISVRAQMFDPEGVLVNEFHHLVSSGMASGYYKLPYEWSSGRYRLRFTATTAGQTQPRELITASVAVYNDLDRQPASLPQAHEPGWEPAPATPTMLRVSVDLENAAPSPGEPIRSIVRVRDEAGRPVKARLSVSVIDDALCGPASFRAPVLISGPPLQKGVAFDEWPRYRGRALDSTGTPLSTPFLSASLLPLDTLLTVQTEPDGQFIFHIPPFPGPGSLQFADYRLNGIRVEKTPESIPPAPDPLPLDESILRYLELSRQRKKIYQIFDTLEMRLSEGTASFRKALIVPDSRLNPDDYGNIKDVPGLFRDIITPLKFRYKEDSYTALMFNTDSRVRKFFPGSPVFFIDGQFTRNADFIAGLSLSDIRQVDLFYQTPVLRKYFGALGRFGVARIETKSRSVETPLQDRQALLPFYGEQAPADFPLFPPETNDEIPRFRPQVYWAPSLSCDDQGNASLRFNATDDISRFRIRVVAVAPDGSVGIGEQTYEAHEKKGN